MALVVKDRVRETSTSTGTGDIILNGAVQAFQDFSVIGDGNTTYYTIVDATTGAFEVGIGTYTLATTTLSRDTVLESSNAGAAVNFAANVKDVFVTYPAERAVYGDAGNVVSGYTISGGSINNTPIGAITPSTGSFSSLVATTADINGGSIDGTTVGASTPSTVASTNLSYTGTLTGGTGVINIGSGQIYKEASGDVGIGTTAPASRFAVVSPTGDPSSISFLGSPDGTTANWRHQLDNSGYSGRLRIRNNAGTETVHLNSGGDSYLTGGNVGIGTSSPTASIPLTILSNSGNAIAMNVRGRSDGIGVVLFSDNADAENGRIDFRTNYAEIKQARNAPLILSTNSAERARIDAAGNVGIGTSSPTMKLDISGTSYGGVYIKSTSTNYSGLLLENTNSATKWQIGVEGGTYHTAGKLNIGIDAVGSAIIIDSSRNVGIGTSSPAAKLDVVGGMNLSGQLLAGASGSVFSPLVSAGYISGTSNMYLRNISGTNRIDSYNDPITATIPLQLNASQHTFYIADAEKVRIDAAGSVGIGTSSPGAKLTVKLGNIGIDQDEAPQQFFGAGGNVAGTNTTGGVLTVFGHAPNGVGDTSTPPYDGTNFVGAAGLMARGFSESAQYRGSLEFFTKTASNANATSRMIITHDGNVGIGTSSANKSSSSKALTVNTPSAANYAALELSSGDTLNWHINSNNAAVYDVTGGTRPRIFYTNGSERLRITSAGSVGIGTSTPTQKLTVNGGLLLNTTNQISFYDTSYYIRASTGLEINSNDFTRFLIGGTEKARIDASGNLLVDRTSAYSDGNLGTPTFQVNAVVGVRAAAAFIADTTGAVNSVGFVNPNGTVGTISVIGTTTAYNTSSDYRLKENVAPMTGALATVAQLNPVTYNWKADGSSGQGFIAHELQAVVPDAVTGEKDAVDKDGKPIHQGVDTSFLVATLTAAIQELSAKVDTLQTELNTLKGN
jgi:hypothetical protein